MKTNRNGLEPPGFQAQGEPSRGTFLGVSLFVPWDPVEGLLAALLRLFGVSFGVLGVSGVLWSVLLAVDWDVLRSPGLLLERPSTKVVPTLC